MQIMSVSRGIALAAVTVLSAAESHGEGASTDAPVRVIYLHAGDATCACAALVVAATNKKIDESQHSGCSPATVPYIFVTSTPSNGPCDVDGASCVTQANSKCSASVTATLVFPPNSCLTQVGVTGPGIGDGSNPCQTASDSPSQPPVSCTWNLTAECKVGAGSTTGKATGSMKIYAAGCSNGQPPSSGSSAEYKPQLNCAPCESTDQG
ncbi:MAG: hypothetical protein KAI24_02385 [Planctomycetes bacterium]|nr:hypothetical protein [Planctomycetota bacterium]